VAGHALVLHRWLRRIMHEARHGVEWCHPFLGLEDGP
jgi:hypothetical protein